MALKHGLGYEPRNLTVAQMGQDIDSRVPDTSKLRFIEVRGNVSKVETITVHQKQDSLPAQHAEGICAGDRRVSEHARPSGPLIAAAIPA
jgi:hypothetical protein